MEIKSISANNFNKARINQRFSMNILHNISYGFKSSNLIGADTISFSARVPKLPPKERMTQYAVKFLENIGLKEHQPLRVEAESKYVPFLRVLAEEAYKKGSGQLSFNVLEPELEILKSKYGIIEKFDYQKEAIIELKNAGAQFLKFDESNCPYSASGLNEKETVRQMNSIAAKVPNKIKKLFELDPVEIFKTALDIREGQPVYISGEREHLPQIVKLVDWLYSQNKSKLILVQLNEIKEFNPNIAFLKYAKDDLIGKFEPSSVHAEQEFLEKNVASLYLRGGDPELYKEIDAKRMADDAKPFSAAANEYRSRQMSENPWLVYYAPTTMSARMAYSEYSNPLHSLQFALKDAKNINRVGKLSPHINALEYRASKLNEILDKGFRTIHFVSVDPVTKLPNGKTDLRVGLSEKSFFGGARMEMKKNGHKPIVNVPTEEVFSSPQANLTQGKVSATMPLVLNGKVVKDIEMTFEGGNAIKVNASENLDMLNVHIKSNENADKLGEVAIVAGSPIAKLDRLFYSTLLDENAACHVAIGRAYPDVVKGVDEIEYYAKKQEYLKDLHINTSTTHNDFMIGGKDVYVYAENGKGDQIPIIIDDKFML